jgi:hypothetical protein
VPTYKRMGVLLALVFLLSINAIQTKGNPFYRNFGYGSETEENLTTENEYSLAKKTSETYPRNPIYEITNEMQNLNKSYKIGFVEPVFTYAAYSDNSFYNFYHDYKDTKPNVDITRNIGLLRGNEIPDGPFKVYNAKSGAAPTIPYIDYFSTLRKHVEQMIPRALVNNITDIDVHFGRIFDSQNHSNSYDILFLFHSEYLTQEEYDNLRLFVVNGGTIVFTEANALYAEIKYDADKNSITLVKGHNWEFNGTAARKSVAERWPKETSEWTGSNFMYGKPTFIDLDFLNLPFNYTHSEEQHVTNKNATILHNYGVHDPKDNEFNATVATYEMHYGKGKVIGMSLYGHTLVGQEGFRSFLKMFDYIIIPHALVTKEYELTNGNKEKISIPSIMRTGVVSLIDVNKQDQVLTLNLKRSMLNQDNLTISIPRAIIGPAVNIAFEAKTETYEVVAGGKKLDFDHITLDSETGFEIPVPRNSTMVQIHYSLPTFSIYAPKDISMEAQGENTSVLELGEPKIHCNDAKNKSLCDSLNITNNKPKSLPIGSTYVTWVALDPYSGISVKDLQKITVYDDIRPDVKISRANLTILNNSDNSADILNITGSAYDKSGIERIEAFAYTLPFNGLFSYKTATPIVQGDWSKWSISLEVAKSEEIGITARATDKAGNRNWDKGVFSMYSNP